jgi:plasmid maintenance system antidote protein VapI
LQQPVARAVGAGVGENNNVSGLRLAHFFGASAQFWLNLQSLYELRLAQQKAGKAIHVLPRLMAS